MIYLDNPATTFPKPPAVKEAMIRAMEEAPGNPGRSSHAYARRAADLAYDTREKIASLFAGDSTRVVFCSNATHALNLAIKGLLPQGGHVLISEMEHNSVLRPVAALATGGRGSYGLYRLGRGRDFTSPEAILTSLKNNLTPQTRMIVACHRSNVLSAQLPLAAMGAFAAEHGLFFVVDASQSAGCAPIDMEACRISALCAPGHKGLLGPRGSGFVIFGKNVKEESIATFAEGGSGSDSSSLTMPSELPERLEAGTLALEAIAGLGAGVDYVRKTGVGTIDEKETYLASLAKDRLSRLSGITVYGGKIPVGGLLLFNVRGITSAEAAGKLDEWGIATRAGLHCAPLAHRLNGTLKDGAVRAGFGWFNSENDVKDLTEALRSISHRS